MIQHTKEEILEFVTGLWEVGSDKHPHRQVRVGKHSGWVEIQLSDMYAPPGLSFAKLQALATYFGTQNINDEERFSYDGCETCDYGSTHGFSLTIREEV